MDLLPFCVFCLYLDHWIPIPLTMHCQWLYHSNCSHRHLYRQLKNIFGHWQLSSKCWMLKSESSGSRLTSLGRLSRSSLKHRRCDYYIRLSAATSSSTFADVRLKLSSWFARRLVNFWHAFREIKRWNWSYNYFRYSLSPMYDQFTRLSFRV